MEQNHFRLIYLVNSSQNTWIFLMRVSWYFIAWYTRCSEMHVWITSPSFSWLKRSLVHIYSRKPGLYFFFFSSGEHTFSMLCDLRKLFGTQEIKSSYSKWLMLSFLSTRWPPVSLSQGVFIKKVFLYLFKFWGRSWEMIPNEFKKNSLEQKEFRVNQLLFLSLSGKSILTLV